MEDPKVSTNCVIAYSLWAASLAIWALAWLLDERYLASLSIIVAAAAATGTVRSYFVAQSRRTKAAIALLTTVNEPQGATVRTMR